MTKRSFNRQIAEEAAGWAVRFDDGPLSPEQRRELVEWLKASPVHVDEFLTALALFEGAVLADPERPVVAADLLAEASVDVVPIDSARPSAQASDHARPRRRRWLGAAAAAIAVVSLGVSSLLYWPTSDQPPDLPLIVATDLGEQRSVTLDDGSIVYVNTQSRIAARYTDQARTVELLYGEALFDVEHDPARPFRVIAGDTVVEALGTTFNVRFIDEQAEVSVVEGTVAFGKRDAAFESIEREAVTVEADRDAGNDSIGRIEDGRVILSAGQRAGLAGPSPAARVASTNVEAVTAWTTRKLVFDGDDLTTIAAEFNRYNHHKLTVPAGLAVGERFSGTFAADDPESFVEFLELTTDIESRRFGNEIQLREGR